MHAPRLLTAGLYLALLVAPFAGCGGSVTAGEGDPCTTCAMPEIACWDGSSPYRCGLVSGACGAIYKGCPDKPAGDCTPTECGPPTRTPAWTCEDGTLGGNTGRCLREATTGTCSWEFRNCPRKCDEGECGAPPPSPACPGGGATEISCRRQSDETCRFVVKCPGAVLNCSDARTWPDFSRTCKVDADCATVEHQVDCCGTHQVLGIATTEKSRADTAEKTWRPTCPECDCVAAPTKDDTGATSKTGKFGVRCSGVTCTSYAM